MSSEAMPLAATGESPVPEGLVDEISALLQGNGLKDLAGKFDANGLGPVMASWVGTGSNHAISPDQLEKVLSPEVLEQIAKKLGMSAGQVLVHLVTLLPKLVDQMTPGGKLPAFGMLGVLFSVLKSILGMFLGGGKAASPR